MAAVDVQYEVERALGVRMPRRFAEIYSSFERALLRRGGPAWRDSLAALFFIECAEEQQSKGRLADEGSTRSGWTEKTIRRILERIIKRVRRDLEKEHQYLPPDLEPAVDPEDRTFQEFFEGLDIEVVQLLQWYFVEGCTLEEVAKRAKMSRSSVHRKIDGALRILRERSR